MQHNMNVDLSQTLSVTCEKCEGSYFEQALIIRKVSALLTGQGKPGFVPIPIFKCSKCGHVNEEFLPKEVQAL